MLFYHIVRILVALKTESFQDLFCNFLDIFDSPPVFFNTRVFHRVKNRQLIRRRIYKKDMRFEMHELSKLTDTVTVKKKKKSIEKIILFR